MKNYRPVSNIPCSSKSTEKFAINNINRYIEVNDLGEELQSAYKPKHSTETALYKVKDDIIKSICQHKGVYLVLLDLSSAFDTYEMLLKRLVDVIGVRGNVLKWVQSYLSGRTTRMCIDKVLFDPSEINFGLPQSSIVGPSMFSIYIIPLGDIIRQFGISFHMYADDIQLYISFNPKNHRSTVAALDQISQCIKAIKIWTNNNMLKLNNEKTEFTVIASKNLKRFMSPVSLLVEGKTILPEDSVRNLGVVFDSQCPCQCMLKHFVGAY